LVPPEALPALERMYCLSEPVLRSLTVWFEKEDQLTGFTRVPDDDGREEDRDDRRCGGRRGESVHMRGDGRSPRRGLVKIVVPTLEPEHLLRLSHGQMRTWTTRVHDYHERLLKEGQEYGKFQ
jgi:hypothetical protein